METTESILDLIIEACNDLPPRMLTPVLTMAMSCRQSYYGGADPGGGEDMSPDEKYFLYLARRADPKYRSVAYKILQDNPDKSQAGNYQGGQSGIIDFKAAVEQRRRPDDDCL